MHLRVFTVADGLAGDSVTSLLPDSRGFLWIGTTTGLSRFDGVALRSFGVDSGVREAQIRDLGETPDGRLWVLTRRNLVQLDTTSSVAARAFTAVGVEGGGDLGLAVDLHVDAAGTVWTGSSLGLFRLDRDVDPPVLRPIELKMEGDQPWVSAFSDDGNGGIWIGSHYGLLHRTATGEMRRQAVAAPTGQSDRILELALDVSGRLWIATGLGAIVIAEPLSLLSRGRPSEALVAPHSGRARLEPVPFAEAPMAERIPLVALPSAPGSAVLLRHAGGAIPKYWLNGVFRSPGGAIWMRAASFLFRFDEGGLRRYGPQEGMVDHTISAVAEDRSGGFWIGTSGSGLVGWPNEGLSTVDGLGADSSIEVGAVFDTRDGKDLIVAGKGDSGTFLAVRRGGELREITPRAFRERDYQGWGWNQVYLNDSQGEWWLPAGEGLLRFGATARPELLHEAVPKAVYSTGDGLGGNDVFRVFEDSKRDVWISTLTAIALTRWRRASEKFETFAAFDGYRLGSPTAFAEDSDGTLWIGLYKGGLARRVGEEFRFFGQEAGLLEGLVTDLLVDRKGRLWVGGFGGLTRSEDPRAPVPVFARVTNAEGRWDAGVRCLVEDAAGRIYVGGDQGVDRLEPESGRVTRFTTVDGLASNLTTVAHRDARGDIWIGTRRGVSHFDPGSSAEIVPLPAVRFVGLAVGGEERPLSAVGEVEIRELVLPAESRRLEVAFAGLAGSPVTNMRYQAWLTGVDDDWSPPSAERNLTLAGLGPGDYELRIRAIDELGRAGPVPALLSFRVQAPVWRRTWFLALVAALLMLSAWVLHRRRVARLLALERVRSGIAADLHDDLGSSLARISLLAGVGSMRAERGEAGATETLAEVGAIARELSEATSDIVWSIDPRRDDLASLVTRLKRFALDLLEGQGVAVTFDATTLPAHLELAPQRRRDLFLLLKEAIHNVAKHAQAQRVEIRFGLGADGLEVEIADDGVGFSPEIAAREGSGNGLQTMRRRAEAQSGSLRIESAPGSGTRLSIRIPV